MSKQTNPSFESGLPVSPGEGRYLCGLLYRTLLKDPPVGNGELADYLDVTGASVSEMFDIFDELDLVTYEPYYGASLTDDGETLAREILWRRCTVQRFFERVTDVHLRDEQAYRIGCLLTDDDVHALGDHLDRPCRGRCLASSAEDCPEIVA